MNNKERVYNVLSQVLQIPTSDITEDTGPDNVESWDSFNALMLISEFEEHFSVQFTISEVEHVKNVRDIIEILQRHGVKI